LTAFDTDMVRLRCCAYLKPAQARRGDHDEERPNGSLPQGRFIDVAQRAGSDWRTDAVDAAAGLHSVRKI
jgi:hypothetical protein